MVLQCEISVILHGRRNTRKGWACYLKQECVLLFCMEFFCILVFGCFFLTWVSWSNTATGCGNVSAVHRVTWAWVLFCSVPVMLLVIRLWRQRTIIDGKGLKSLQKESRSLYLGTSTLLVSFLLVKHFVFLHAGPPLLFVTEAGHK